MISSAGRHNRGGSVFIQMRESQSRTSRWGLLSCSTLSCWGNKSFVPEGDFGGTSQHSPHWLMQLLIALCRFSQSVEYVIHGKIHKCVQYINKYLYIHKIYIYRQMVEAITTWITVKARLKRINTLSIVVPTNWKHRTPVSGSRGSRSTGILKAPGPLSAMDVVIPGGKHVPSPRKK